MKSFSRFCTHYNASLIRSFEYTHVDGYGLVRIEFLGEDEPVFFKDDDKALYNKLCDIFEIAPEDR